MTWINIGSCRGDTIFHYLNQDLPYSFDKIYAIEGDKNTFNILNRNLQYIAVNEKQKIETINIFCGMHETSVMLEDLVRNEKVGLINMDIEGAELDTIESMQEIIKKDRPVLAICAYHKPDDLLVIPNRIMEFVEGYQFFLRKSLSGYGMHWQAMHRTNELVLYAVPKEKVVYFEEKE